MTAPENPTPEVLVDPSTPVTKAEAKRLAREAKAVKKANRSWVGRHKFLTGIGAIAALVVRPQRREPRWRRRHARGRRARRGG